MESGRTKQMHIEDTHFNQRDATHHHNHPSDDFHEQFVYTTDSQRANARKRGNARRRNGQYIIYYLQ